MRNNAARVFRLIFSAFVILLFGYGFAIYGGFTSVPFKIIDPSDSRFDPTHFRFEDYPDSERLEYVLNRMFPPGTQINDVDRFLIEVGGAKGGISGAVREKKEIQRVGYFKPTLLRSFNAMFSVVGTGYKPGYRITVEVDNEGSVKEIHSR